MYRLIITLILLCTGPSLAAPGIAVESTADSKVFAELAIVGLMTQSELEIYDAIQLRPEKRPQFTVVFDRVRGLVRVRVLDEKTRKILAQFQLEDLATNAWALRAQSRNTAVRVIDAARGHLALN